jgi:hypothetical protein
MEAEEKAIPQRLDGPQGQIEPVQPKADPETKPDPPSVQQQQNPEFWAVWNRRKKRNHGCEPGCTCFEGLGSMF